MNRICLIIMILAFGFAGCVAGDSDNNRINDATECDVAADDGVGEAVDSIPMIYREVVDTILSSGSKEIGFSADYFLFDVTGDSVPELWTLTGTCEADMTLRAYTSDGGGNVRKIYEGDGGHSDLFVHDGELVCVMCNTGTGFVMTYRYRDGRVVEDAVEFSTWNDEGKALSNDSVANRKLDRWETGQDGLIAKQPMR